MDIASDILRQSLLLFLWVGGVTAVFIGTMLWFKPEQLARLNQYFSRWIGAGKLVRLLDKPRPTERLLYRHNRLVGVGLLLGAMLVLYTFLFGYNPRKLSALIPHGYWWLSDALLAILLVGSVLAALVGFVVLIRPSLLRDTEKLANRWVSTERLPKLLNSMNFSVEQSILRHHRYAGVSITAGGLYVVGVLGYIIFKGLWRF